ncbi:MAG: YbhB/YbcL family Raf kinase inhibitor-like protein [Candidatus Aegiribacteria sp.]|nr:YbhB/YbcL family Raf kinase inhibitor-like protein [Candidatus Aegiribacteria sp.]
MNVAIALALWSSAFGNGELIPVQFTADGDNLSPPLEWQCGFEAESFALICEDPDAPAGIWVHWVIYNIPGESRMLEEGVSAEEQQEDGTLQGENSWGSIGYGGPAPPSGKHRYIFTLYALEGQLHLDPGATAFELREAIEGQIIEKTEFVGEYTRE